MGLLHRFREVNAAVRFQRQPSDRNLHCPINTIESKREEATSIKTHRIRIECANTNVDIIYNWQWTENKQFNAWLQINKPMKDSIDQIRLHINPNTK